MSKPPAFQFYPADFLVGIMGMSDEEIGIYMKMLSLQWLKGSLPNSPKTIKNLINSKRIPSDSVMEKFDVGEDGNIRNQRLEKEREKQESFKQSRIENANKRWDKACTSNARAKSSMCKTDALQSSSSSSSMDVKREANASHAPNGTSPDSKPPQITWSPEEGFDGITEADRAQWAEAYPAVNLNRGIAAASEWLKRNPAKRKKQVGRFLSSWLARDQEKGGDRLSRPAGGPHAGIHNPENVEKGF